MDIDSISIEDERDRELLRDIQDYGLKEIRVGFSSEILNILDDPGQVFKDRDVEG